MNDVRPAAVAGMFYPDDKKELQGLVQQYIDEARSFEKEPKALIAPHAGYIYSGPIAGSAYAQILPIRDRIKKVILIGPSHRVPFKGISVSSASFFSTPLGNIPIDKASVEKIKKLSQIKILDTAHAQEHSLEVHLPFLQKTLSDFSIVPLVVGDATPEEIAEVLEILWGGPETLIVVSSDLSHYHDYETARNMDQATSRAIEALRPQDIQFDHACGRLPINGLLLAAKKHGLRASTIDLRNSGDTAGSRDQVVGYGAYVFV